MIRFALVLLALVLFAADSFAFCGRFRQRTQQVQTAGTSKAPVLRSAPVARPVVVVTPTRFSYFQSKDSCSGAGCTKKN